MIKLLLNEKKYIHFIKKYKYILSNLNIPQNHFDNDKKIVGFCLVIFDSVFSPLSLEIKQNSQSLLKVFNNFYSNAVFYHVYDSFKKGLKTNNTKIWDDFVNDLLNIFPMIKNKQKVSDILHIGLAYVLFNCIPCKISSDIEANIMNLKKYEKQKSILMKNVELFAKLKACITSYFKNNSNNVICLILGLSQRLF